MFWVLNGKFLMTTHNICFNGKRKKKKKKKNPRIYTKYASLQVLIVILICSMYKIGIAYEVQQNHIYMTIQKIEYKSDSFSNTTSFLPLSRLTQQVINLYFLTFPRKKKALAFRRQFA